MNFKSPRAVSHQTSCWMVCHRLRLWLCYNHCQFLFVLALCQQYILLSSIRMVQANGFGLEWLGWVSLVSEKLADSVLRQGVGAGVGASSLPSWHPSLSQRKNSRLFWLPFCLPWFHQCGFSCRDPEKTSSQEFLVCLILNLFPHPFSSLITLLVHGHFLKKQW